MSDRWSARTWSLALCLVALLGLGACRSDSQTTHQSPTVEPTVAEPAPSPTSTPAAEVSLLDRQPSTPYLPTWLPDGFELESVTWFDDPEEIRPPDWLDADAITLGDSAVLSDTSVQITARRFANQADLDRARWIEDALMVSSGGPSDGLSVEGALFLYDSFGAPIEGGQFHATIGDVLVTGLIFGEMSNDELEALLSSLLVGDEDAVTISVHPDAAGLLELEHEQPDPDGGSSYELRYANGAQSFTVFMTPGESESTVAVGSVSRDGDRFDGLNGTGFLEAQPEVGSALGSKRLIWWVPTVRLQVWYGSILTDEQAVDVADSVTEVDAAQWQEALDGANTDVIDFGPMNLPDDPEATYQERLAEENRAANQLGARPDVNVAEILEFVTEFREGTTPLVGEIDWLGPIEAAAATSSVNFFPADVEQAFRALQLIRPYDGMVEGESRRQDIRGVCCGINSIQLVEGMQDDEAAVVAAHEFTHLFDTTTLDATFPASSELFSANSALIEGNANRVMIAYRDAFDLRYNPENRPYLQLLMTPEIRRALTFAYEEGQTFTEALAAEGGEAAINRAFEDDPPLSTEHILHPDHYLAGDRPTSVRAPAAPEGAIVDQRSTLGAFVIALAALDELGWDESVELAGAWTGDSFVAWSDNALHCLAATIEFDDDASAQTFADLARGEATSTGNTVNLQSCG